MKAFLAGKGSVHAFNNKGNTALHLAAERGHSAVVTALLVTEALVDTPNADGITPLGLVIDQIKALL